MSAGDFVSTADIAAGKLRFAPAANANGAGYASFTFQVRDNGGTANGGVDLDATPNTITIDVTSVNDAPAGANTTVTVPRTRWMRIHHRRPVGSPDPSDSLRPTPAGEASPGSGAGPQNVTAPGERRRFSAADIAAPTVRNSPPAANANGAGLASFSFQVQDNGGTANGGVDLDPTPNGPHHRRHGGQRRPGRRQQDRHRARGRQLHLHHRRLRLLRPQ